MVRGTVLAISILGLTLFVSGEPVWALRKSVEQFPAQRWPYAREKGSYRALEAGSGRFLWKVDWQTTVTQGDGQTKVQVVERGQGQPLKYKEPVGWEKRMVFFAIPEMKIDSMEGSRWTERGQLLSRIELKADPERRRIRYRDVEMNGPTVSGEFPLTTQVLPDELLFHWARTLNFNENPAGECQLVVSPTRRFWMRAWVRGTETVTTPAGTFHCHRVELLPDLGPLRLLPIRGVVPKLTLWCTTDPPHFWVRYLGPMGGPGSPQARMELVRFEPEVVG